MSKSPAKVDGIMQTLAWLRKNQFLPVQLNYRSKAAISRAYTEKGYVPPPDDVWRTGKYGVGAVTGVTAGNGLIDCDLDNHAALHFGPKFLPHTDAIFGRPGKPKSHMLYRVTGIPQLDKYAYADPITKKTIIEIRGDGGHQTVMPGSLHQDSGELIEWSNIAFPTVPTVDPDELLLGVRKVALASLIVEYCWGPSFHNDPTLYLSGIFYHLKWKREDAVDFIQKLMEYDGDTDRSRIPTVNKTFDKGIKGQRIGGAGKLRKALGKDKDIVVTRILEWAGGDSEENFIPEYNERFAVVREGGKFRIVQTDIMIPGEPLVTYTKEDFLNFTAPDCVMLEGKKIPKGRLWLASPQRRTFDYIDFLPGIEDTSTVTKGPAVLNLWPGWGVEPKKGDCSAWLELLRDVICGGDEELYNWAIHWFANMVREPLEKPLTAMVVIGPEGAGKSLLLGYFGKLLGAGYLVVTNPEHIHGNFNKHMATTVMLHSEEALYGGDKKHASIIRSLITDEHRIFEQKGVDARMVRNYIRLVLTSNDQQAAPAQAGDRRYTVINMGQRKLSDDLRDRVLNEIRSGGPAALFHYLLKMDYDPLVPRRNVKNKALSTLKTYNLDPMQRWWYDILDEGELVGLYLKWATEPNDVEWPPVVATQALHLSLRWYYRNNNIRGIVPSLNVLWTTLENFTGCIFRKGRVRFVNEWAADQNAPPEVRAMEMDKRCKVIANMPSLYKCRAAFEKLMGQQFEWTDVKIRNTTNRARQRNEVEDDNGNAVKY